MVDTLSLLGFTKDIIGWIVKFVQPKIDVKPKKIHLTKTTWNKEGYFVVYNKTETPLFDTQIVAWLPTNLNSPPPLKITNIEDQDHDSELTFGNMSVNSGAFILSGKANNKGIMLLQLRYLPPKSCKRVYFSAVQQVEGDIAFQVISTSNEPTQDIKDENKVAIPFKSPMAITVSSMSFYMKRT
ncbi:hypothetical protein C4578_00755 [Candidatus Microgenomates bacterium]|jgi:hypothetical protein|nr:MAG: hypothetical protein C4578_00755 [Candidatus Microgenomates bacterium]